MNALVQPVNMNLGQNVLREARVQGYDPMFWVRRVSGLASWLFGQVTACVRCATLVNDAQTPPNDLQYKRAFVFDWPSTVPAGARGCSRPR